MESDAFISWHNWMSMAMLIKLSLFQSAKMTKITLPRTTAPLAEGGRRIHKWASLYPKHPSDHAWQKAQPPLQQ